MAPRFDELDGEVEEEPGLVEAAVRSANRAGTLGFADEINGWVESRFPRMQLPLRDFFDPSVPTPAPVDYKTARDSNRELEARTAQANPVTDTAAGLAVSFLHPLNRVGGSGWMGAARGGALQGAVQGVGDSTAELTDGDVYEYVRAAGDAAQGAGVGAALGATGERLGTGLKWAGGKARGLLDDARGRMFDDAAREDMAALARRDELEIGRREKARAAEAKSREKLEREQGRALEMNKAFDRRAAREADRGARSSSRSAREAEPNTRVLEGMEGKAFERVQFRGDKARKYRDMISRGEENTAVRRDAQDYIDRMPEALDNPGAARRIYIERFLRQRYPPEVAERVLRERFDAGGRLVRQAQQLQETTQLQDAGDWARRGDVARAGGGGSAWDEADAFASQRTRVDPAMQPDPFHDAPTRAALIRTSEPRVLDGYSTSPIHEFNFRDPKTGRDYLVIARESPHESENLVLEIVRPLDVETADAISPKGWEAERGKVGPGMIKQLSQELARAFPGRRILHAERATGANPREHMSMRLPEVTSPGNTPPYEPTRTQPMDLRDAIIQGRGEEMVRQGGGGSAWQDFPEDARTVVDLPEQGVQRFDVLQPPPEYRGDVERRGYLRQRPPAPAPPVDEGLAMRRAAAADAQVGSGGTPTRNARPPAEPSSMRAPVDVPEPAPVPETDFIPGERIRSPAMERAMQREQGALGAMARAGYEGARSSGNSLGAVLGASLGITREALHNPAVRARALQALRLAHLERANPAAFARVGRALAQATMSDPEEAAVIEHVASQTDADFRAAMREADERASQVSDEELVEALVAAGVL